MCALKREALEAMPRTKEDEGGRAKMKVLTLEEENTLRAIGNLPPLECADPPLECERPPLEGVLPHLEREPLEDSPPGQGHGLEREPLEGRFPPFPFRVEHSATRLHRCRCLPL